MASAVDSRPNIPLRASPPPLLTSISSKGSLPLSNSVSPTSTARPLARNPNPIRSMLDIAPARAAIPEETHSSDGSEEPHEAVTPTSGEANHHFHHVIENDQEPLNSQLSNFSKPLTPIAAANPLQSPPSVAIRPATANSTQRPTLETRRSARRPSKSSGKKDKAESDPPSPTKTEGRPSLMKKAKSFLKRSNSRVDQIVGQYAGEPNQGMDGAIAPTSRTTTTSASSNAHSNGLTMSSRSSRTSRSHTPPSPGSPSSTVHETHSEMATGEKLTKSKTSNSHTHLNRFSTPRAGITWGAGLTDGGLQIPISPRRRSASTEQVTNIRRPNQHRIDEYSDDDEPVTTLTATFSTKAGEGVGLKSRRLSITLPDDFVVMTKDLEKEYKSTRVFHSKGNIIGKGATANVSTMCRRDGPKDELYAVKEFRARDKDETQYDYEQKIKSEYTLANSVNHPNIVRTFDLCLDKAKRFNHVMEYCPLEFYQLVEKGYFRTFYTPEARLCFFKQLLRAVAYLHDHGIAHRDIKLENILMNTDGYLKLTDFGVSEVFSGEHPGGRLSGGRCGQNMGEKRLCPPGICGSLPYLAPEVISRDVAYDPTKYDVWSCAIVWMTLCCGGNLWMKPDEENENYAKFMKGWRTWLQENPEGIPFEDNYPKCGKFMPLAGPPALKKVILKMMHPDPNKRISVQEALNSPMIKNAECCAPESFEDLNCTIDASKKCKPKATSKMFKHNHIPPKDHKMPKALQHRFDMGNGWQ